jgi:tetratricopeptide (TPR) repeat protein
LLLRESQTQPVILLFEDLHWIDSETQALLDSLVDSLATAPILLLVNYRPEYQHAWGSKTTYTQLRLDPLSETSAEAFLQVLLGNATDLQPLKQLLIARTEGNPFFLEESVRTLVESQALEGEPGAYRLVRALSSIQVPATVQAILAARIDRLSPEDKELLQTAAVLGTEVSGALLQAIAGFPETELSRGLSHLQAAEFLYETQLFPEREYTFKHALTHEVAYGSLLQERRRVLHARTVEALETLAGDRVGDHVEALAHHAWRGELWSKALLYSRQAGEKARMRSANREAVACFERALVALGHLPERREVHAQAIDLRLGLRGACLALGEMEQSFRELQEAEQLATALDDQRRLGWISSRLAAYFYAIADLDQVIVCSQRAFALATASQDTALQTMAEVLLGFGYQQTGDYQRAMACCRQAMAAQTEAEVQERLAQGIYPAVLCRAFLAWTLAEVGQFAESLAMAEDGLRIAEADKHPANLVVGHCGVGIVHLYRGNLHKALPQLQRAMDICHQAELPYLVSSIADALGSAYVLSGRIPEALSLLEDALAQADRISRKTRQVALLTRLAEASLRAGRQDAASSLAQEALVLSRTRKERGHEAYALRLLGDISRHQNPPDFDAAEIHYQQALDLSEELGMRPLQAHCHRGLGNLYCRMGQPEQARAELSTAIDMYREMAMTFWLPETEAALADVEKQ